MQVRVNMDDESLLTNQMLKQYNGKIYEVSRVVKFKNSAYFFELKGCESKHGIPYAFCREWLMRV